MKYMKFQWPESTKISKKIMDIIKHVAFLTCHCSKPLCNWKDLHFFHMIVTVGDASPRQARGHIGDCCVKWEHFLKDVADVADQTGTVRGRIERVEMSSKRGFHMIITVIVSTCRRLIGDTSPKGRRLLRSYGNQALQDCCLT